MDKSSKTNAKNKSKNTRRYFFNNYSKNIKSRNFEEDKNSPFNNNDNINVKSYEQIYSLNKNKYGFSPNEPDLSYERNNTLLNDAKIQNHNENIYKKILLQNNSKKSDKRTFKIIKCEKINANKNNKNNTRYNNIEINKHIKNNDIFINKNKDIKLEKNIVHKTFLSQDLIEGQFPKNYSTSFSKMSLNSENSLNNFRKTIPRVNNNILVNQIIKTELSEPEQKPNFFISKDMNNDIFNINNANNKNEITKGNKVLRKNKLNECRYREKMKKLIKNKNIPSPITTKENTLENTIKKDNKKDIINKGNNDKNSNSKSNNRALSKKCFVSKSSINILKKESKDPNTFIKKSDCDINKLKINLFNDDDDNNNKINSKNKDIIFTKKKVNSLNNKDKKKNIKNIYHKNIIKNNNSNHIKYKTMEEQKDLIKEEPKNKNIDIELLDDSINDTEKEIFYNKLSQDEIKNIVKENKNINVFDKYIKNSNPKNKAINCINLNKNKLKNKFINQSEKNNNTINIAKKMKKYLSIRNITLEDINSKSFKNISRSNDLSSYSNNKNNTSRENNNNLNSMSNRIDSNIIISINRENNNISKINNKNDKISNIKNIDKTKIKKNIMSIKKNNHLIKENEDKCKNSRKTNKKMKDYENKNITNYIYNNKPINKKINFSKKNLDIKINDNILLKNDIKQNKIEFEEKIKNISNLYGSNSKDSEYNNDNINTTKEIIKELNEHDLNNIQINSLESQFISNINSPNSNTFSGFNKSDIKFTNKINFDMPINIDLEKIETEESKEDSKIKNSKNKIKKENKAKKDAIKIDVQQSISSHKSFKFNKFEKLENFINKLNDEDEDENEEEEEPEEEIIIQNNKIVHYNSDLPAYGRSIAEKKLSKDNTSNTNSDNKNDSNKKINDKDNNIRNDNMDKERIKLYNFDLESKGNENGNKENNTSNNGFYDDIDINTNTNNKVNEREKSDANYNNESYNEKRFNIIDMNIDPPHADQDFLGNLELIQRNNNIPQDEKEVKKNNNIINNDNNNSNNNNIKEIESEYEFNLSQEKFYKPLNKYENVFNFGKINRFKS